MFLPDPLGGAELIAAFLMGRFLTGRKKKHRVKEAKPECGCGHNRAFHVKGTGKCSYEVWVTGDNHRICGCQIYTGPEPLPEYVP